MTSWLQPPLSPRSPATTPPPIDIGHGCTFTRSDAELTSLFSDAAPWLTGDAHDVIAGRQGAYAFWSLAYGRTCSATLVQLPGPLPRGEAIRRDQLGWHRHRVYPDSTAAEQLFRYYVPDLPEPEGHAYLTQGLRDAVAVAEAWAASRAGFTFPHRWGIWGRFLVSRGTRVYPLWRAGTRAEGGRVDSASLHVSLESVVEPLVEIAAVLPRTWPPQPAPSPDEDDPPQQWPTLDRNTSPDGHRLRGRSGNSPRTGDTARIAASKPSPSSTSGVASSIERLIPS